MRYDITPYKIPVPDYFDGPKRVLVLSDIHGDINNELMQLLSDLEYDAIFIPGDLTEGHIISGNNSTENYYGKSDNRLQFLKRCVRKKPTYYSRGNHEWKYDEQDIKEIRNIGVIFLENEYIRISNNVLLGALASPLTYVKNGVFPEYNVPNLSWLNEYENQQGYKILLCHHPEYYHRYLKNRRLDLIVSGHAHGGQIRIRNQGLFAPGQGLFPQYTSGIIDEKLIISRGMSNTIKIIPRIANKPEIVVLEMESG